MKKIITLLFCISAFTANLTFASPTPPSASFSAAQWSGCAPFTATFYNASSGGTGSYAWNFGDPLSGIYNTSSACSPVHTFNNPGTYTVQLTFTVNGNPYTVTHTVTVHPRPNPNIAGKDTVCDGATENYTVSGTAGSTYFWTTTGGIINGATNSSSANVNWPSPGVHTLSVTETTAFGCSKTKTIKVLVANQPRLGNFCNGRKEGSAGNPKDSSIPCICQYSIRDFEARDLSFQLMSNDIYSFQWTVTGGTIISGQGTNSPQIQAGAGPTMTVTLVVSNPFGCTDSGTCVYDICPSPTASFVADTACLTSPTHFNALASSLYGQITSFTWNLGNGNIQNGNTGNFEWTFPSPGIYPVTLTVTYANGCSDDTTVQVLVKPGNAPPIGCVGTVCHNTKHCYGTPYFADATYSWSVTGGLGTPNANGDSICVQWGNGPLGNITLNVTGGPYQCGRNSVNVSIFPATLNLYGPDTVCVGDNVNFSTDIIPGSCYSWTATTPGGNNFSINPSNNPGNLINGNFPSPGIYTLELDVENQLVCCKGKIQKTIVVQDKIKINGSRQHCEFSTINYSSNVPVIWGPIGNGTLISSTTTSCTIQWGAADLGYIRATAISPNLVCDNDITLPVTLVPRPPNPAINGPAILCKGTPSVYSFDSSDLISSCNWNISPAGGVTYTTTSRKTKNVLFTLPGTYVITVNYTGQAPYFCTSTSQLTVTVVDTACPSLAGPTSACIGQTSTYTIASNPGNIWQWSVIGGSIISQTSTSLSVTWNNINQGQVIVQNIICPKLCIRRVTINAIPTGAITLGKASCKGDTIRLFGPPGYSYSWSGPAGTGSNQQFLANTPGLYTLIISQFGCSATITQNLSPIPKLPKPNVNVVFNCMISPNTPIPYQMTATYNPNWQYSWSPQTAIPGASDTLYQHYSTVSGSTHTVIVTNEHGCKDTASVTVSGSCTATGGGCSTPCNAVVNPTYDPCTGQFTANLISGNPSIYFWDFGDGFYSNLQNPEHWYYTTGSFMATLSYYCNCTWVNVKVPVNVPYILRPKLKLTFPINCNYKTVQLNYAPTSVVIGSGITWNVDWGDGSPLYIGGTLPQNHTYSYTGNTDFIVTYTVSAPNPLCTVVIKDTLHMKYFDADFSFCNGCVGQPVQLVDQSSSPVPIVQWRWNFGDATTSNLQSPFHIYNNAITYFPKLVITNQQGCKDSQTYPITITVFNAGSLTFTNNGLPATPTSPGIYQICEGDVFVSTAPFNSNWTYSWNDGKTGNKDTIKQSGLYWVIVGNGNGCTDTLGPFQVIVNPRPNATILAPDSICSNLWTSITALQGVGYSYAWSSSPAGVSGTGSTAWWTGLTGPVNVYLQITNTTGCTARDTALVIGVAAPTVSISNSTYAPLCKGDSVQLNINITGAYNSIVWSTGQTGVTSIWVYQNGTYDVTITNPLGCSVDVQASVSNIYERPDIRNVPKGCYAICSTAAPVKICGPYAITGQPLSYQWFLNNNPFSTNPNLSITGGGNYHLEVTHVNTNCKSVSAPFSVTLVPGPVAQINSPSPNPVLCVGQQACITVTANQPASDILYTWYEGSNPLPDTGTSLVICHPGVYILQAFKSECCTAYDTLIVKEGDCCWDSTVNYTVIQDSTVYTTNQVWDGKYFVAGRLFVRNKAVLDMTTIDVVFDRDGEIIFEDSSQVRANNSVFRPCDLHDVWVGFTFKDSSSGLIHTSLFKNAKHAVDVNTQGTQGVKITDNTFSNCHIGIRIFRGGRTWNEGITKNSFVIDNYNFTAPGLYPNFDYFGLMLNGVRMEEIISQNDFRNSDRFNQPNRYYGIYALRSGFNASENRFTNMYRSIDAAAGSGFVNIENNEIEKTSQGRYASDVQIRVSDHKEPMLIFGNELRNSDSRHTGTVGIFAENMFGMNIRDNNIKGFDIGIWSKRLEGCIVNENDIDQGGDIGILDSLSRKLDINCNVIRLKDCKTGILTSCNSVGIYMQAGNNTNNIYTNCIFDTRRGIFLRSNSTGIPVPMVVNNYIYNYLTAGINIIGHTGSIGNITQPGRNTFVSNNYAGGAREITASPFGSISESCNFGVLGNGSGVNTTVCPTNTMQSSTAACGQQINNPRHNRQDKWDICENYTGKNALFDGINSTGVGVVKIGDLNPGKIAPRELVAAGLTLIHNKQYPEFELFMQKVSAQNALSQWQLDYLKSQLEIRKGNSGNALQVLNAANPATDMDQEEHWLTLLSIQNTDGILMAGDKLKLAQIAQSGSPFANVAYDLLHAESGNHDYRFGGWFINPANENRYILPDQNFVNVMPNPTENMASVQFSLSGNKTRITLHDLTGNLLMSAELQQGAVAYKLDLRNLSDGVYLVGVTDIESGEKKVTKLVKQ